MQKTVHIHSLGPRTVKGDISNNISQLIQCVIFKYLNTQNKA
uniref:Uncharacterized protein n=1 Tax=Anguilla anguilla TaxID=7936 RepID=A0A0E9VKE4_ANGAN